MRSLRNGAMERAEKGGDEEVEEESGEDARFIFE